MESETQKNKILQLEQRIMDLENKFKSLTNSTTIPIEIENALIGRGFQNVGDKELIVYYEAGVGANAFTEKYRVVKFRNKYVYYSYEDGLKQFTVNTTTNVIHSENHGFVDGRYLAFRTTDTLPAGIDSLIDSYTVINATANTYQATIDGVNPVDITSAGSGDQYAFTY